MTERDRYVLMRAAYRAARIWHGTHTGGPYEQSHLDLLELMREALRTIPQGKGRPSKHVSDLTQAFYPR